MNSITNPTATQTKMPQAIMTSLDKNMKIAKKKTKIKLIKPKKEEFTIIGVCCGHGADNRRRHCKPISTAKGVFACVAEAWARGAFGSCSDDDEEEEEDEEEICCSKCDAKVPDEYLNGVAPDEMWVECSCGAHSGWYCPNHSPTNECWCDEDCDCCN